KMSLDDYWNSFGLALSSSSFYNQAIDGSVAEHLNRITESVGGFGERIRNEWNEVWMEIDQESRGKQQNEAIASVQNLSDALRALSDLMIYRLADQSIIDVSETTPVVVEEVEIEAAANEDWNIYGYGNENYDAGVREEEGYEESEEVTTVIDYSEQSEYSEDGQVVTENVRSPLNDVHRVVNRRPHKLCELCQQLCQFGRYTPTSNSIENRCDFLKSLVIRTEEEEQIVQRLLNFNSRVYICNEHIAGRQSRQSFLKMNDAIPDEILTRASHSAPTNLVPDSDKQVLSTNYANMFPKEAKPKFNRKCDLCGLLSYRYRVSPKGAELAERFFHNLIYLTSEQRAKATQYIDNGRRATVCRKHVREPISNVIDMKQVMQV
ncbi:hypothetical protein PFISCL1PPCAC_17531, partial [Pristionchus fissidentatus]